MKRTLTNLLRDIWSCKYYTFIPKYQTRSFFLLPVVMILFGVYLLIFQPDTFGTPFFAPAIISILGGLGNMAFQVMTTTKYVIDGTENYDALKNLYKVHRFCLVTAFIGLLPISLLILLVMFMKRRRKQKQEVAS